jgi:hypothetical protein
MIKIDKFAELHINLVLNSNYGYTYSWLIHEKISDRLYDEICNISADLGIFYIDLIDKTWPTYHYLPPRVEYIFPRHCYWSHRLTHNPAKYNCHKYTVVYNKRIHNRVEEYYKFPNHNRLIAILGYSPYYNRSNRFVCCIYFPQ